jgi:CRP-like cAMP-binding protein
MQTKAFNLGKCIFREKETGQVAFIIETGSVEMTQTINNNGMEEQKTISILNKDDMFGEMALIDHGLRMATARAKSGVVTHKVIYQRQFNDLLKDMNPFAKKNLLWRLTVCVLKNLNFIN